MGTASDFGGLRRAAQAAPVRSGRRRAVWVLLVGVGLAIWLSGRPRGTAGDAPIDWRREPVQTPTARAPFELVTRRGALTLTPRAAYDVAARVEGVERYRFDDLAFLSPVDFALTWGELPTPRYRDAIDYSQSWRFYFWRSEDLSIDPDYVIAHSANTHLIPANDNVEKALAAVDRGDEVRLTGLLVDVDGAGLRWRTSTVRTDHGDGGCEILFVESVEVDGRRYE